MEGFYVGREKVGDMMLKRENFYCWIITVLLSVFFSLGQPTCLYASSFNVVIISLTSLRADHLPVYGYFRDTAPNIDKFASQSIVFEQAIAQSNWTLPSQVSIFSSQYVHSHGIYKRDRAIFGKTLPVILRKAGYFTGAFVGGLDMSPLYGFNKGFNDYECISSGDGPIGLFQDIIPKAISWLERHKKQKFFLFIQGYDMHFPFSPPSFYRKLYINHYSGILKGVDIDYNTFKQIKDGCINLNGEALKLSKRDINYIISLYDAQIVYADKFIGMLLNKIKELDLADKTIIVIMAEHGEELFDHGNFDRYGEGILYDEVVRVPLIIKYPGLHPKRVSQQVQLIDLAPTILNLLNIPPGEDMEGKSFLTLLITNNKQDNFDRYSYSEASLAKYMVRTKEWKLIYNNGEYELYNLKEDRYEHNNLAQQYPSKVFELLQVLSKWRINLDNKRNEGIKLYLTDKMKEDLKRSGYW